MTGRVAPSLRRPRGDDTAALPAWMHTIDSFTPLKSVGLGVLLSAVNPKNLLLTVAAGAAIAQAGTSSSGDAVALTVFVVLGTVGPGLPLAVALVMGARARTLLDGMRSWMATHNSAIMAAILLVIGAKLLGDGIAGLAR
jgi:threonine/homoserine/homoserine lactone efflux protein